MRAHMQSVVATEKQQHMQLNLGFKKRLLSFTRGYNTWSIYTRYFFITDVIK